MDNSTPSHLGPVMLVPFVENIFLLEAYLYRAGLTGRLRKHQKDILKMVLFYAQLDASYSPAYLSVNMEVNERLRRLLVDKPLKETGIDEILDVAFNLAKLLIDGVSPAIVKRQPFFGRTKTMLEFRQQQHRLMRQVKPK